VGSATFELPRAHELLLGLQEAGSKVHVAAHEIAAHPQRADAWVQRVIYREIEQRARLRGPAYWEEVLPGLPPATRADARIRRMLSRATVASVAAAAGATSAELLPLMTESIAAPIALPIAVCSVGAEMLYTTVLQIDLAFDLASIYGVPFAADDVGEISTMLAAALGVELVGEPTRHDKPAAPGETKSWRVQRQMLRSDFARHLGNTLLGSAIARNVLPVAGIVAGAAWNQIVLRRFAREVHTAVRRRLGIVNACRGVRLRDLPSARSILDGAYLIATADGDIHHQEALALATLIDSLNLPDRIAVQDASFTDDEEAWFAHLPALDPGLRPTLLRVLVLVASATGALGTAERRFLKRVARALPCEIHFDAIERFAARVRAGEAHADGEPLELAAHMA
jgi:tellurite resistance protein